MTHLNPYYDNLIIHETRAVILILQLVFIPSFAQQKTKDTSISKEQVHQVIEDLHKEVQYRDQIIFYDLKAFNGACNYKIWVNDMPVYNMFKGARGELNFMINGKIVTLVYDKLGQVRRNKSVLRSTGESRKSYYSLFYRPVGSDEFILY